MIDEDKINLVRAQFDRSFYNKVTPILNQISGLNPRDQFSVGLFLNLGVRFNVRVFDGEDIVPELKHGADKIKFFMSHMDAYVELMGADFKKNSSVVIELKVGSEDALDKLYELLGDSSIAGFLAFVYLHEVQHILRKHNTESFNSLMKRVIINEMGEGFLGKVGDQGCFKLMNIAEDYAINFSLVELIEMGNHEMSLLGLSIKNCGCLYHSKYSGMSELDILKDILKNDEIIKNISYVGVGNDGRIGDILESGEYGDLIDNSSKSGSTFSDKEVSSLAEGLKKTIEKQKGKEGFKLDGIVDNSVKVDVLWFDKLRNGLFNFVSKKTKYSVAKWSGLDNKMRHIYKAPVRKNIDRTVDLIVSVDQSGSISYDSLGKLLYLFEQKSSKINEMKILFHDTKIVHIDNFSGNFNPRDIIKAVKRRHCGGGTSHRDVFSWMDKNLKSRDIGNKIYISFSDNYSDVEECYGEFRAIKKISKIWLNSDGRVVDKSIPGVKVNFS